MDEIRDTDHAVSKQWMCTKFEV